MKGKMVFSLEKDPEKTISPVIISLTRSSPFPLKWMGSFSSPLVVLPMARSLYIYEHLAVMIPQLLLLRVVELVIPVLD
jgi:hypothetical protein